MSATKLRALAQTHNMNISEINDHGDSLGFSVVGVEWRVRMFCRFIFAFGGWLVERRTVYPSLTYALLRCPSVGQKQTKQTGCSPNGGHLAL